jgi:DNA polymerase III subunit epsilon
MIPNIFLIFWNRRTSRTILTPTILTAGSTSFRDRSLCRHPMLSQDLIAHYRQRSQQNLTIVDLETTGFKAPIARVIEVAVIQANLTDGIQHKQTHLLNPGVSVPEQITRITGISQAMVAASDPAEQIWPEYLPLLSEGVFTAHNVAFDYPFVKAELELLGQVFHRPHTDQMCTVILSRLMLPELPSRSLPDLVRHFDFKVGRSHRAEADTMACWLLAQHLLTEINDTDDEQLCQRFGQQWLPLRDVAQMFSCRQPEAKERLKKAGIEPRQSSRSGAGLMYQRYGVEQVFWDTQGQQGRLI